MKVRISGPAQADLRAAFDFIHLDNPRAATAIVSVILRAADSLAEFSDRGRPGLVAGTRELVVRRTGHVITYRVTKDEVIIARIRHGRQDRAP